MKLKKLQCVSTIAKIQKLALLLAVMVAMSFVSRANAQHPWDPLNPVIYQLPAPTFGPLDGLLFEQNYLPEPPYIFAWQPASDLPGVDCQRSRQVTNMGCNDWVDGEFGDLADFCFFYDHGVADYQVGDYVPGYGCTNWKSIHYTVVSGDGSQTGTLID